MVGRAALGGLAAAALVGWLLACDDLAVSGVGAGGGGGSADGPGGGGQLLEDAELGDPGLASAQRISFGPDGVLLVADGALNRLVAIETGDVDASSRQSQVFDRVDQLANRVAKAIDESGDGNQVWIYDLAVNPISWRVYLAASLYAGGEQVAIVWVDGDGTVHRMALDHVVHAALGYPTAGGAGSVQEVGWEGGYLLASVADQNGLGHLLAQEAPLEHEGLALVTGPTFYHPGYGTWLDDLVADGIASLTHNGAPQLLAAFTDGPLVRYGVETLAYGLARTTGTTVCTFGFGRVVRDMEYYQSHGEGYLVASIYNLAFDGLVRAARVRRSMLMQVGAVDQEAPELFDFGGTPLSPLVERLWDLDGAERLAVVGGGPGVVVMRNNSLEWLELPEATPSPEGG